MFRTRIERYLLIMNFWCNLICLYLLQYVQYTMFIIDESHIHSKFCIYSTYCFYKRDLYSYIDQQSDIAHFVYFYCAFSKCLKKLSSLKNSSFCKFVVRSSLQEVNLNNIKNFHFLPNRYVHVLIPPSF